MSKEERRHRSRFEVRMIVFVVTASCLVVSYLACMGSKAHAAATTTLITGKVTADKGDVRGFRVKIKDTNARITYTVFTRSGRYQVGSLPAGHYEIRVLQAGFDSPTQQIDLAAGQTKTVDLQVTASAPVKSNVELADFDTVYPPGPDRDLLMITCSGCHGKVFWHKRPRSEQGWREAVEGKMTAPHIEQNSLLSAVPPVVDITPEKRERIIQYLTKNFGEDSPRRDLKPDTWNVDESEVANAMNIEYDLPEASLKPGQSGFVPRRGLHSVAIGTNGTIWSTAEGASTIIKMDSKNMDFSKRFQEIPIESHKPGNSCPDGITLDHKGNVFWTEVCGNGENAHLSELDPLTGEMTRFMIPSPGTMHTPVVDSKGDVWYTMHFGSKLGVWDTNTHKITDYEYPTPGTDPYGIIIDHNDNVWTAALAKHMLVKFDPRTKQFTEYRTPSQPSGPRRLGMDSKGKIWFSEYSANKLGYMDPATGKISEYDFPMHYTTPYETWPDLQDNIWSSDDFYSSMIKYDQRTKKFVYYPLPQLVSSVPKIEVDKEGTIWFASRGKEVKIVAFKPEGNALKSASQK